MKFSIKRFSESSVDIDTALEGTAGLAGVGALGSYLYGNHLSKPIYKSNLDKELALNKARNKADKLSKSAMKERAKNSSKGVSKYVKGRKFVKASKYLGGAALLAGGLGYLKNKSDNGDI